MCSSDLISDQHIGRRIQLTGLLESVARLCMGAGRSSSAAHQDHPPDRIARQGRRGNGASISSLRSEERREGKSVDLGGRRIIKKKKKKKKKRG